MGDIDIYIVSVNVGKKTVIPRLGGGNLATGINKQPVSNAVDVDELGLVDDNVCNTIHHGGLDQAVYLYRQEDYDYWSQVLEREREEGERKQTHLGQADRQSLKRPRPAATCEGER